MCGTPVPAHEATVSPELAHLLAEVGRRVGRRQSAADAEPAPRPRTPPAVRREAPWRSFLLRRDGARPVRIEALLIHRTEVRVGEGGSMLRIFATSDGRALAQISYLPPPRIPARPVFRVAPILDADDLQRFIDGEGPEQCFAVDASGIGSLEAQTACNSLRLPRALPGLARSAPL